MSDVRSIDSISLIEELVLIGRNYDILKKYLKCFVCRRPSTHFILSHWSSDKLLSGITYTIYAKEFQDKLSSFRRYTEVTGGRIVEFTFPKSNCNSCRNIPEFYSIEIRDILDNVDFLEAKMAIIS